jgi:S1-C subfamily serine protease
MTLVDWIILAFTLLMALWGYSQGLVVGALSLAGFIGGAFLGSRVGPLVLEDGAQSPYAPLFALVGAFLIGGILSTGFEVLGFHVRRRLGPRLGVIDGLGGAVLIACAGLVLVWVAGSVALQTPGARDLRKAIQRSQILQALNDTLPPSGPLLNALARFDPFPRISGPDPGVAPPTAKIARDPQVAAAGQSVVRVLGTACGLGVAGSGWVAEGGIVVTNAHVVAGQDDTTVQLRGEGPRLDAEPVWFDSRNDLALLRVPALDDVPALELDVNEKPGTAAAILGFPGNGPYDVQPGRLGRTETLRTDDAYGRGPIERRITTLRGLVRSGNSGGPMVDGDGQVVTTIFAATVGNGERSGFGVPDTVVRDALGRASAPVGTGECAH